MGRICIKPTVLFNGDEIWECPEAGCSYSCISSAYLHMHRSRQHRAGKGHCTPFTARTPVGAEGMKDRRKENNRRAYQKRKRMQTTAQCQQLASQPVKDPSNKPEQQLVQPTQGALLHLDMGEEVQPAAFSSPQLNTEGSGIYVSRQQPCNEQVTDCVAVFCLSMYSGNNVLACEGARA